MKALKSIFNSEPNIMTLQIQNMQAIRSTYDLKSGNENSNQFYHSLDVCSEIILHEGMRRFSATLECMKPYYGEKDKAEDILLDILILGTLWNTYSGKEIKALPVKSILLTALFKLRKHHAVLKKVTDKQRGILAGRWLAQKPTHQAVFSMKEWKKLKLFLRATGEFKEELIRISRVENYLKTLNTTRQLKRFTSFIAFATYFQKTSHKHLSTFTCNVIDFQQQHQKKYFGKEDYFLCGRAEAEYHLNMVGAAFMNKSLKEEYEQTQKKVLLLPTCMAASKDCKAKFNGRDISCSHCNKDCSISRTTKAMQEQGVKTVLIQHSSKFSQWLKPWSGQKETALIGVACVLHLLMGGFEMKRLNIPSQCVFLDHCGCKKHWLSGTPTDINVEQLIKTVS